MTESLALFESVINSRWFLRTSIILFLNKIDVFKVKLPKVSRYSSPSSPFPIQWFYSLVISIYVFALPRSPLNDTPRNTLVAPTLIRLQNISCGSLCKQIERDLVSIPSRFFGHRYVTGLDWHSLPKLNASHWHYEYSTGICCCERNYPAKRPEGFGHTVAPVLPLQSLLSM